MELLQAALGKLIHPVEAKPVAPIVAPELLASIEASVTELQRELGPEAAIELLASFLNDTPVALAELTTLAKAGVRETFARAAHSLAGSCSIFGLDDMRHLALELEEHAAASENHQCDPLIARLNERYLAVRPILEHLRTTITQEPASL